MKDSAALWRHVVAVAVLPLLALGCVPASESAAAEVPERDVRTLPSERLPGLPDRMMEAADASRVLGGITATVRMLVISDYQCDSCRIWFEQRLPVVRNEYIETHKASLTWVHYPLRRHPSAVRAASATLCAGVQGKFWESSTRIFAGQALWSKSPRAHKVIDSLAAVPGLDKFTLDNCIESTRMLRQVRRDIDWTDTAHAGTPFTLLIGARRLSASSSIATLRAVMDSAISGK